MQPLILRLIALCMFVFVVQCGPDAIGVRVHVIGVTPDIHSLHVNAVLDGKPAMQGAAFTQQLSQFTIKVPTSTIGAGQLAINVAGLGIDHCRLSAGRRDIQVSKDTPYVEIDVSLVPSKICTTLDKITPSFASPEEGIALQLEGQNFAEGASVTVDGVPATDVVVMDSGRLRAVLPARPGAFGRVPVVVSTPDGQSASRSDLFSYYAKHLEFSTAAFPAGMEPDSLAVGDFNGDQKLDIAVVDHSPGSSYVNVILGNGMGGFGAASQFTTDYGPDGVAVGDFNGDQKLDLAVANFSKGNVSVLLGNGGGGFGGATNFVVGNYATSVATGDFNGDQKLDLAVGTDGGGLGVLLGNGLGQFVSAGPSPTVGMNPRAVAVGYFNGDLKADIAVANYGSSNVSVLLSAGAGVFSSTNFPAGQKPLAVATGDFNGDLKLDLVIINDSTSVSVLLANLTGGFGTATTYSAGTGPVAVAVGDFNGDQTLDLAVGNYGSHDVSILLGNGTGSFSTPYNFPVGSFLSSLAVGDFNGDGKPDLAASYGYGVAILSNVSQ